MLYQIVLVSMMAAYSVSITLDTSKYSPTPPENGDFETHITLQDEFPFTSRFTHVYNGEVIECMQEIEQSFIKNHNCTSREDDIQCHCLFMNYVDENCVDVGLKNDGLWELEKVEYPECQIGA